LKRRMSLSSAVAATALVSGMLFAVPASVAAAVQIQPMIASRFVSATQPPTTAQCEAAYDVACYTPTQLEVAYNEQPLFSRGITGAGQTIVIVDAFGSPTIQSDLETFDQTFGLPAPPSLKIIQPAGPVPPYNPATPDVLGWAVETSLDVEYAHSMAPGANIVLVETPVDETEGTAGFPQIVEAENYVVNHHIGDVISQSFGATEGTFPSNASIYGLRSAYVNAARHGVTVLAATGDAGSTDSANVAGTLYFTHPAVDWPSTDPLVTAVGGTKLSLDANGLRTSPDTVWNDTYNVATQEFINGDAGPNPLAGGGGKSMVFGRPWYQNGVRSLVGDQRGVPDISMSAACSALVDVYLSAAGLPAGWYQVCGTSEATPLFAGIVALSDQVAHHRLGLINPALYFLSAVRAPGLVDVTSGNNTVTFTQNGATYTVPGYSAGPGYDLASGVGTVNAALFVPELARVASFGFGHGWSG
jgi:subtilase family serine protease